MQGPRIPGLQWQPTKSPHAVECRFTPEANAATVDGLVRAIPRRGGLRFYDHLYHGEPAPKSFASVDHGAIFCVYRRLRGGLFATRGHHGWSQPWTPVGHLRLVHYLSDCLDSNRGEGPRSSAMLLEARASYVPRRDAIDPNVQLFVRRDSYAKWREA